MKTKKDFKSFIKNMDYGISSKIESDLIITDNLEERLKDSQQLVFDINNKIFSMAYGAEVKVVFNQRKQFKTKKAKSKLTKNITYASYTQMNINKEKLSELRKSTLLTKFTESNYASTLNQITEPVYAETYKTPSRSQLPILTDHKEEDIFITRLTKNKPRSNFVQSLFNQGSTISLNSNRDKYKELRSLTNSPKTFQSSQTKSKFGHTKNISSIVTETDYTENKLKPRLLTLDTINLGTKAKHKKCQTNLIESSRSHYDKIYNACTIEQNNANNLHNDMFKNITSYNKQLELKKIPSLQRGNKNIDKDDYQLFKQDKDTVTKPIYIYYFTKDDRTKFLAEQPANVLTTGQYISKCDEILAYECRDMMYKRFGRGLRDEIFDPVDNPELDKALEVKMKKLKMDKKVQDLLLNTEKLKALALKQSSSSN